MNTAELKARIRLLKAMNLYMVEFQPYAEATEMWEEDGIPEEASEDDIEEIARDTRKFTKIVRAYARICEWIEKEEKES